MKNFTKRKRTTVPVNVETFGGPWDGSLVLTHTLEPGRVVYLHGSRYELRSMPTGPFKFYYIGE